MTITQTIDDMGYVKQELTPQHKRIWIERKDLIHDPLWYHKRRLMQTRSGYGSKLTTEYKIRYNNRLHRIYVCIHSNSGVSYIISKGEHIIVEV